MFELLIVLFLGIGLAAYFTVRGIAAVRQADTVAREFLEHVRQGRPLQAYYLTSSRCREALSLDDHQDFAQRWLQDLGEVESLARVYQGGGAGPYGRYVTLTYQVDGLLRIGQAAFYLTREGRDWRIQSYTLNIGPSSSYSGNGKADFPHM